MGRPRKNQNVEEGTQSKLRVLQSILNDNKDHHYAFDSGIDYVISSGSLTLDMQMSGGIHPGIIRSSGVTE